MDVDRPEPRMEVAVAAAPVSRVVARRRPLRQVSALPVPALPLLPTALVLVQVLAQVRGPTGLILLLAVLACHSVTLAVAVAVVVAVAVAVLVLVLVLVVMVLAVAPVAVRGPVLAHTCTAPLS